MFHCPDEWGLYQFFRKKHREDCLEFGRPFASRGSRFSKNLQDCGCFLRGCGLPWHQDHRRCLGGWICGGRKVTKISMKMAQTSKQKWWKHTYIYIYISYLELNWPLYSEGLTFLFAGQILQNMGHLGSRHVSCRNLAKWYLSICMDLLVKTCQSGRLYSN